MFNHKFGFGLGNGGWLGFWGPVPNCFERPLDIQISADFMEVPFWKTDILQKNHVFYSVKCSVHKWKKEGDALWQVQSKVDFLKSISKTLHLSFDSDKCTFCCVHFTGSFPILLLVSTGLLTWNIWKMQLFSKLDEIIGQLEVFRYAPCTGGCPNVNALWKHWW